LLGNFLDTVSVQIEKSQPLQTIASTIHSAVKNYQFDYADLTEFIRKAGGSKKIHRIIPKALLPQEKNLLISSWANFGAYSIDFGIEAPFLFLPVGKSPLPWVSNIVEGPNNQGLLVTLILPTTATQRLLHPDNLIYLHRFRSRKSPLPEHLTDVFV
jgi:Transferase family